MRPASHMPLAERMTLLFVFELIALESSELTDTFSPSKLMGLMP